MPFSVPHLLVVLAATFGLGAAPCLDHQSDLPLMIAMCGGGAPVSLPIKRDKPGGCQKGCHGVCRRRKAGDASDLTGDGG
jgi:hypothetical protein